MTTENKQEKQPEQVDLNTALTSRMESIMNEWSTFDASKQAMIEKLNGYVKKVPKDYVVRLGTLVRRGPHRNDETRVFFINETLGLARTGESNSVAIVEVLDKGQFKAVSNLEPLEVIERIGANGFGALLYAALGTKLKLLRKINTENAADGISVDDIADIVEHAQPVTKSA